MTENKKKIRTYRNAIIILSFLLLASLVSLVIVSTKVRTIVIEREEAGLKNIELQSELDSLMTAHDTIKSEYGQLSDQLKEKDSLIIANATEIQKLIIQQVDYKRIKKKLEYLRNVTQSYVTQMDSLFRVNAALNEENIRIRGNYQKEQKKNLALTRDKEQLTEKVTIAAMLKAYNVISKGIRVRGANKEIQTDKAKRTNKIKVCFTLSQNLIVSAGSKDIYLRIAKPDNNILVSGRGDEYSFVFNGEKLQYSAKKGIKYENRQMNICMYFDVNEELAPGTYDITLFTSDYEIGQGAIELK